MGIRNICTLSMSVLVVVSMFGFCFHSLQIPEPIVNDVDAHFSAPGIELVPSGEPHTGDSVKVVSNVIIDGHQTWTKHGVVVDLGGPGDPDSANMNTPSVMYDNGEYKMWYAATDDLWPKCWILYANSSDGITWNKHGVVFTFGPPLENLAVITPNVIKDGSIYRMWYAGWDGSNYRIFSATSPDGLTWTRQGLAIDIGSPGSLDSYFAYSPYVMIDGMYRMWYAGFDGTNTRILYANSSDGVTWVKQGISIDTGPPGSLDDAYVNSISVLKEGGGYHAWYTGSDGTNARTFYATSDDGIVWDKKGMVVDVGPASTDSVWVFAMNVLHLTGKPYQMWYTGRSSSRVDRIHYANLTSIPLPTAVDVDFFLDSIVPASRIGTTTVLVGNLTPSIAEINWTASPAGNHTICAVIDPLNKITEWNETNNTACLTVRVLGVPPVADAGPDVSILEGQIATLDGSGSYDPDGTIVNYTWDLDTTVDSDGDGDTTNDIDSTTIVVSKVYGDDGTYCAMLTVTDDDGLTGNDTACVEVTNVAPIASVHAVWSDVNVTLRVAGRKWNQVGMELYAKGSLIVNVTITRMPGSPDDQSATVSVSLDMFTIYQAIVRYYPNVTDKGEIGGNPVWIILSTDDGKQNKIHHTFNVQQSMKRNSSHWNHVEPWIVDINAAMIGLGMKVDIEAIDPGSDDIKLEWSSGETMVFYNNGVSPDPPHSPEGVFPFVVRSVVELTYRGPGLLTLVITDDDGGSVSMDLLLP